MRPLLSKYIRKKRTQAVFPYLCGNILDLGCGVSIIPKFLQPNQIYVGIDNNFKKINAARKKYPEYIFLNQNLEIDNISIKDDFDTILLLAVLEHLNNPSHILNQIPDLLSTKGKLIITTPTKFGGFVHTIGTKMGLFHKLAKEDHKRFYKKITLIPLLKEKNLTIIKHSNFLFFNNQLFVCQLRTH